MVSAILMAGYKNKREVKKYSKTVAEHYGEKFIETGYRPLREFEAVIDGKKENKPLDYNIRSKSYLRATI